MQEKRVKQGFRNRQPSPDIIPLSTPNGSNNPRTGSMPLGQINAARRRNNLIYVRELIKTFNFTIEEIQGKTVSTSGE